MHGGPKNREKRGWRGEQQFSCRRFRAGVRATRMSPSHWGFSNPRLRGLFLGNDLRPLLEGLKDHLSDWRADSTDPLYRDEPQYQAANAIVRTRRATLRTEAGNQANSRSEGCRDCADRA